MVLSEREFEAESNVAFDFVRTLAAELSRSDVDLPSFPEIAVRVRRVCEEKTLAVINESAAEVTALSQALGN